MLIKYIISNNLIILLTVLICDGNYGRLQNFSSTNTFNPMYLMFTSSSIPPGIPVLRVNGLKLKIKTLGKLDFQSLPMFHLQYVEIDDYHVEMTGL